MTWELHKWLCNTSLLQNHMTRARFVVWNIVLSAISILFAPIYWSGVLVWHWWGTLMVVYFALWRVVAVHGRNLPSVLVMTFLFPAMMVCIYTVILRENIILFAVIITILSTIGLNQRTQCSNSMDIILELMPVTYLKLNLHFLKRSSQLWRQVESRATMEVIDEYKVKIQQTRKTWVNLSMAEKLNCLHEFVQFEAVNLKIDCVPRVGITTEVFTEELTDVTAIDTHNQSILINATLLEYLSLEEVLKFVILSMQSIKLVERYPELFELVGIERIEFLCKLFNESKDIQVYDVLTEHYARQVSSFYLYG